MRFFDRFDNNYIKEKPMKPIIPFEPIATDLIPDGFEWVGQIKWDGVRVLTYFNGSRLRLFNRRLNERTYHYPELVHVHNYCSANSVILDGEIIALKEGKPSFSQVMKRDGITNLSKVKSISKTVPIIYMVFDVLYYNEEWITSAPLSTRQSLLEKIISPKDYVQVVDNFQDSKTLFEVVRQNSMEGIIIKDINSTYLINGKDSRWRKKKFYQDIIAVVGGVTYRGSLVNSMLLGLYDHKGKLWYIGHVGTGKLTQEDWRNLTKAVKLILAPTNPFENSPPRIKEAVWLKPVLKVKVKFSEWTKGQILRHPSIEAFVDLPSQKYPLT